jgi:asparagine synthase (glutamine-hydrolysing)
LYDNLSAKKYTPSDEELEKLLTDSLERQLHSDVPIGLFLSSGIDSSLLASLINKNFCSGQKYQFFSVAFKEGTNSDESVDAKTFLSQFNNNNLLHTTLCVDSEFILEHLEDVYRYYDEPFGDHASLLNWVISKKAKEHVTVALSGDGGDELFWGYSRYTKWARLHGHKVLKNELGKFAIRSLNNYLPFKNLRLNKLKKFADGDLVGQHFSLFQNYGLENLDEISEDKSLWALDKVENAFERCDFISIIDMKTYLADAMLYKVDRSSMAASLEVRVPFLDNTILDYSLSLALEDKSTEIFPTKAPLKKLLVNTAPHYNNLGNKKGFNFPLNLWMKTQWREFISDTIRSTDLSGLGLDINSGKIADNFFSGKDEKLTNAVWYIFNLALWQNTFQKKHKVL